MARRIFSAWIVLLVLANAGWSMTTEQRQEYRDKLKGILPNLERMDVSMQTGDELPPDFDALPRMDNLPDPLKFLDGRPVASAADWKGRRAEILQLFEKYAWGTIPPHPKLDSVDSTETQSQGYRTRNVVLHFGPESKATLRMTMTIPDGKGPFPVLMGPGVPVQTLLRRGYIAANTVGGPDSNPELATIKELYPTYDFGSIPRLAWQVVMALDYFETVPEVDMKKVAIYGYSRNGKMAVIAAALDERIGAVIAGSTGVGGVLPYRLSGERNMGESIQSTTMMFPEWFAPRLRFFSGREDRLPIDANLLVDLVAPRACLIEYGLNDEVSNTWGNEECYRDARKLYTFLGAPDRVGILRVPGFHGANDMEACLDFVDIAFGRSTAKWTNEEMFPWSYDQWKASSKETVDLGKYPDRRDADLLASSGGTVRSTAEWESKAAEIRKAVQWVLGDEPPLMPAGAGRGRGAGARGPRGGRGLAPRGGDAATTATAGRGGARGVGPNPAQLGPIVDEWVIGRNSAEFGWRDPDRGAVASRTISFGYSVSGKIYTANDAPEGKKLPAVIWLHSYSYPLGYMWVYRRDLHPVLALAKAGYAVLAYDQSGFGSRMKESAPFYNRYPHWSQLGRMVEDVQQAVTTLQQDSQVDPERIYVFGYSLGGMVALHAAALDPRIKGVVSISGFTPMRTDTADKGTGGVARFSVERGILPRLGFFIGHEGQIPYDYNELIAAIAPRPVMVIEPQYDRDGTPADVHTAVEQARKVYALYNASDKLALDEPWNYTRLSAATQDAIIKWMGENLK